MTSEQKEGHGKERKAREKPDTPSFPTPPAAVPTPQPRFPKPLMLLFICSRNQSWVVPWAGALLEQTVIFTTMVFGGKPAASVLLPSESISLSLVKIEDEGGGGGKSPHCQVCWKMAKQENWEIKEKRSADL